MNTNWRQDFKDRGAEWAIEIAEQIFNTEEDNSDLDLQMLGLDADSCTYVYEALSHMHNELKNEHQDGYKL